MLVSVFVVCLSLYLTEASNLTKSFSDINSPSYFANKVLNSLILLETDISQQCKFQMSYYVDTLLSSPKSFWALQMFDSGAKLPSGIFTGNLVDLGFFEQCINTYNNATVEIIFGKYCIGVIPFTSVLDATKLPHFQIPRSVLPRIEAGLQIATCLPSGCLAHEIEKIYEKLDVPLEFDESLCQTKANKTKLSNGDIAMVSFLAIIFSVILSSTAYDIVITYLRKKPFTPVFLAFSVLTNGKKLIETINKSNQISSIHGIRVLTIMWIILGHKYTIGALLPVRNYLHFLEFIREPANMFVFNSFVSVDTFFLLGGIVVVYTFMGAMKNGIKFNIFSYYIHRYLRLTPLIAVVIGIYATILKHLGSGPIWPGMIHSHLVNACQQHWYWALLYVQNFVLVGDEIVTNTWYLSVDFQLFLISPVLLLSLKKWPRITLIVIGILTILSSIAAFLTSWFLEISLNMFTKFDIDRFSNYKKYFYYPAWIRCSPWLIGIIVGYVIFEIKQRQKKIVVNKIIVLVLWMASLATLYLCVFEGYDLIMLKNDKLINAFHMALVRPSWAIALSWIIFACTIGYGGPVNWFLSLPIFQVISRLTYSIYLTHYAVLFVVAAQLTTPAVFSNFQM
ncbi:hypothetical protein ILUMI_12321, partial [Ignelater luminosus]